jgi:hypothetical protein
MGAVEREKVSFWAKQLATKPVAFFTLSTHPYSSKVALSRDLLSAL